MSHLHKANDSILSETEVKRLSDLVSERMGLHFPQNRQQEFARAIKCYARDNNVGVDSICLDLFSNRISNRQVENLASYLTVGETYFFREMDSLNAFQKHVIPEIISQRNGRDHRVRIWSAGCSTGEEAYTVSILVDYLLPDSKWEISIFGTDINTKALRKARSGIYSRWSFRSTSEEMRNLYFESHGKESYSVRPRYMKNVSFDFLNLATDAYPSLLNNTNAMDVIFCRNVMMYFNVEVLERVLRQLHACLVDGGWLIVAPSENYSLLYSDFTPVRFDGATLYRKERKMEKKAHVSIETGKPKPEPLRHEDVLDKRPTDLYENALSAYRERRYSEASSALNKWISAGSHAVRSKLNIGNALYVFYGSFDIHCKFIGNFEIMASDFDFDFFTACTYS